MKYCTVRLYALHWFKVKICHLKIEETSLCSRISNATFVNFCFFVVYNFFLPEKLPFHRYVLNNYTSKNNSKNAYMWWLFSLCHPIKKFPESSGKNEIIYTKNVGNQLQKEWVSLTLFENLSSKALIILFALMYGYVTFVLRFFSIKYKAQELTSKYHISRIYF